MTLDTERLQLRMFGEADFPAYAALFADPEVARYAGGAGRPLTRLEAWRHLAATLGHWQLRGYGMWAAVERVSGALVGRVGFYDPPDWPGFELGWTLARPHWGRGYATEGARAALAHAFTRLGRDHVISVIDATNERSQRVARRIGERPERTDRVLDKDVVIYGISRTDWTP